jgi:signal transduction histidine kinase
MRKLIEDLLTYSRVERRTVQPGLVNLSALVASLLEERTPDLESHQASVHVAVPPDSITADPESLAQALRNLLDNALKFSTHAPVSTDQTVGELVSEPTIEIGGHRTATAVQLWVKDHGIGFDMAYHDRIFDIFQRLHTRDEYPGTGVGLAIVRRAVERMGGRAWAASTPGQGATFFLEIPQPQ